MVSVLARLVLGELDHAAHHLVDVDGGHPRLALADEVAHVAHDLAGAFRLLADFLERFDQVGRRHVAAAQPADAAAGEVGDRRQRLVEFMGQSGGHFAHGRQAGHPRQFGLVAPRLLLGPLVLGDVARDAEQRINGAARIAQGHGMRLHPADAALEGDRLELVDHRFAGEDAPHVFAVDVLDAFLRDDIVDLRRQCPPDARHPAAGARRIDLQHRAVGSLQV
jgi:hypothetical protein